MKSGKNRSARTTPTGPNVTQDIGAGTGRPVATQELHTMTQKAFDAACRDAAYERWLARGGQPSTTEEQDADYMSAVEELKKSYTIV